MAKPDGTRTGDSLFLLSEGREIAADNLRAIRFIPPLLIFGMLVVQMSEPSGGSIAMMLLGSAIIFLPVYAISLWAFSSPSDGT